MFLTVYPHGAGPGLMSVDLHHAQVITALGFRRLLLSGRRSCPAIPSELKNAASIVYSELKYPVYFVMFTSSFR